MNDVDLGLGTQLLATVGLLLLATVYAVYSRPHVFARARPIGRGRPRR